MQATGAVQLHRPPVLHCALCVYKSQCLTLESQCRALSSLHMLWCCPPWMPLICAPQEVRLIWSQEGTLTVPLPSHQWLDCSDSRPVSTNNCRGGVRRFVGRMLRHISERLPLKDGGTVEVILTSNMGVLKEPWPPSPFSWHAVSCSRVRSRGLCFPYGVYSSVMPCPTLLARWTLCLHSKNKQNTLVDISLFSIFYFFFSSFQRIHLEGSDIPDFKIYQHRRVP